MAVRADSDGLLPHGDYRKLRSYKVAKAVYDTTAVFWWRFRADDVRDLPPVPVGSVRLTGGAGLG